MAVDRIEVVVSEVVQEAEGIRAFAFQRVDKSSLPEFTAGSHIDVFIPGGIVRQYSLSGSPSECDRYTIGVLREENGRGGSKALYDQVRPGDRLFISEPRNHFELTRSAKRYLLLAGGIGITPMMSMLEYLAPEGLPYELHFCTRSKAVTPFRKRLSEIKGNGQVHHHFDNGNPENGLKIGELLREYDDGTHLYFCGPPGFMGAVKVASSHWNQETVHFEHFSAPALDAANDQGLECFYVRIASTGATYEVPADRSIAQVLQENGVETNTSCSQGICGTCQTRYLNGEPQHMDLILTPSEQAEYLMICCSRSKTKELILDL
ncbi:MAG: oxidoreductase [Alphaproteobacteria bacterium]|nr:oxidoreductase [Alphaproteobacteria bacterium]